MVPITQNLQPFTGDLGTDGFSRVGLQFRKSPAYQARVAEAARLIVDVRLGRQDPVFLREAINPSNEVLWRALCQQYPGLFREAMTTSDFTALTADVLDRMLLGNWQTLTADWRRIVKVAPLRDFRTVDRRYVDGGEGLFSVVPEETTHERRAISDGKYSYAPSKYAAGFKLSWEAIINDDLGIFNDLPQRLANGANHTVWKFITELHVGTTGPHASLYTSGNENIINTTNGAASTNPALSIAGLQDAITVLMGQKTAVDSIPIVVNGITLEIPETLYVTAQNLKNQILTDITVVGGVTGQTVRVGNWLAPQFTIVVNPWIPVVASSSNGATSWFVFADPNVGRPALEMGFLRGFENPALYQKAGNTMRVGGGIDQGVGDFDTMSTEYKAMVVFGGSRMDGKGTVASNGSGS
jgi:hypothetical protein